ncbi:MAG: hypothetical protein LBH92_02550 [Bacteroidales bacterium]|nr:hypothetical protein [Bacteroidales bacterium]
MKQPANLNDLHIGNMIKEIASNKNIPSKKIAETLLRYQQNANKIYGLADMSAEDVVLISYLLQYNFLKIISEKYLSNLPIIEEISNEEKYYMELDVQTGRIEIIGDIGKKKVLQKIHIGRHIKAVANKNKWNMQYMAKLLNHSQSYISYLYRQKSLKIKKLIQISNILNHNFIAEAYLNRMFIISSSDKSSSATIIKIPQEVRIKNPDDNNFVAIFRLQDNEK